MHISWACGTPTRHPSSLGSHVSRLRPAQPIQPTPPSLPPTAAVGGLPPTVAELVFFRDAFWRGVESDVARAGSSIMHASSLIGRGYS
jgi:hypothetical protein